MAVSANKLGRYELRREIARSNDVVYEAWDPTVNRRVAVKEMVMPPGMAGAAAQDRIQRFYREARAAGGLSHPNIVTVYEVGEDMGRHFIAMEFLEGPTLREAMQGTQGFPVERAVTITAQLADALEYAHRHGVVHRDVKPDNVHLIAPTHPELTDFGIARIESESNITLSGQVFGTPSYMSPEQVAGGAIDARTDVFSLGVLLFEMVAGRKPFIGESVVTITYNIVHESPIVPPNVPEWLAAILRKAMGKRPEDRYATAQAMADDLRARHAPQGMNAGAADPNGWRVPPGGGSTFMPPPPPGFGGGFQPGFTFQAARPRRQLPRINLPKLSDEARTFATALGVTLVIGAFLAWAIWASSVAYHRQRQAQTVAAIQQTMDAGMKAYDAGDFANAIRAFQAAADGTHDPIERAKMLHNTANSWLQYGLKQGGTDRLAAFLSASKIEPNNMTALFYTGNYYDEAGDKWRAIPYYETVLQHEADAPQEVAATRPRLALIYLNLGAQAQTSGGIDGKSARDFWTLAEAADPAGPAGLRAQMLLRGGQ